MELLTRIAPERSVVAVLAVSTVLAVVVVIQVAAQMQDTHQVVAEEHLIPEQIK